LGVLECAFGAGGKTFGGCVFLAIFLGSCRTALNPDASGPPAKEENTYTLIMNPVRQRQTFDVLRQDAADSHSFVCVQFLDDGFMNLDHFQNCLSFPKLLGIVNHHEVMTLISSQDMIHVIEILPNIDLGSKFA
jgi:hypothetical protein